MEADAGTAAQAVYSFYEAVKSPTLSAIQHCVAPESLDLLRNYEVNRLAVLRKVGRAELRPSYLSEGDAAASEEDVKRMSGAEILQRRIFEYPENVRDFAPQILGSVSEGRDRAWVLFRLQDAATPDDGAGMLNPARHFPLFPEHFEVRRIRGKWQVWLSLLQDHPVPGLRGVILWSEDTRERLDHDGAG